MQAKLLLWSIVAFWGWQCSGLQMPNEHETVGLQTSADLDEDTTGIPLEVVLGALPQITLEEVQAHPPVPAPLMGLTPQEYNTLKAQVGEPRLGQPAPFRLRSPRTASPLAAAVWTPGANLAFVGGNQVALLLASFPRIWPWRWVPHLSCSWSIPVLPYLTRMVPSRLASQSLNNFLGLPATAFTLIRA